MRTYTTDSTNVSDIGPYSPPDLDAADADLARRQLEHLAHVRDYHLGHPSECLHNRCSECLGTGVRRDGGACVHMISCPCPRCSPRC